MTVTELWRIRDIAQFGKWAETYVAQSIVTLPGFPKARLDGGGEYWLPSEVRQWAEGLPPWEPPGPVETALYRHFDANGALLYIGIALSPIDRTGGHHQGSPWFRCVTKIEIEWHPSRVAALEAEKRAIKTEKPKFNKMYNGC